MVDALKLLYLVKNSLFLSFVVVLIMYFIVVRAIITYLRPEGSVWQKSRLSPWYDFRFNA